MTETQRQGDRGGWRLACEALTVRRGGHTAVRAVTFAMRADECVSIVGPNGSGKTTLLRALLGLLPPSAGRVRLNGRDLSDVAPRARALFAAYVPQGLDRVPAFSIREVVAGGRYAHLGAFGRLAVADQEAIQAALERCGLAILADRAFNTLSAGERQKALIAAAIAQDPQIMFLDEPSTALDPGYQLDLLRILREWHAGGRGLLVVSHDLQLPAALGGRIVALRAGGVAADGLAADVLAPAVLSRIYDAPFGLLRTADGVALALPQWWTGPAR
ncbi:MAG: ABC transporter ATP-binding protein [Planctomycetota bacterium]